MAIQIQNVDVICISLYMYEMIFSCEFVLIFIRYKWEQLINVTQRNGFNRDNLI